MFWLKPDMGYKWINKNKEEKFKFTMNKIQHLKNRFILGSLFVKVSITGQFFHHRELVFFQLKKIMGNKYHNEIFNREDLSWNELEKWEILSCEI